jgi:undecaprenyl-phosphate 4-deoxy-4-formamido-L-arabinose transferase
VDVSVVIPVYHGASTLPLLVPRLISILSQTGRSFEILLVDDGSKDGSWKVIRELQASYPDLVTAVQLMRNYGQHNALMAGFRQTVGEFVITMDEDLQHPPEEVPKLLEALESRELDVVYGWYDSKQHAGWRNLGSTFVNMFYRKVFRLPIHPSAFRVIRRCVLDCIFSYSLNYTYVDGLLAWNTSRIGEVSVAHQPRAGGRSGYSVGKLLLLALNMFTNFSLIPLQFVSICGMLVSLGGMLLAAYYLFKWFFHGISVPGYPSLMIAILVLGGIQLLALGILGEYVGRLHLNVNRKPQYSVRQIVATRSVHANSSTMPRETVAAPPLQG